MAKKKTKSPVPHKAAPPAKEKSVGVGTWAAVAVAIVAVAIVVVVVGNGGPKGITGATATASPGATAASGATQGAVPPEEAKYIGRLLPAAYTEPSVAPAAPYGSTVAMFNATPAQGPKQTSVSLADVVANKIVYFEYKKAGSDPVPMVAYVKPSGKLFVGVSFCIPCKGKQQTLEADGILRCSACGTTRDAETGVGISGACRLYPLDELPAKVVGGKIVIDNAAMDQWTPQPTDRKVGA